MKSATRNSQETNKNTPQFIGAAFLLQAVASLVAGLLLPGILNISENIVDTMIGLENNAMQVRVGIMVEMITVIALIILSILLFLILKKHNMKIALVALGFRLTEVALLAASRIETFSLLRISQASVIEGHPVYLQTLGNLAFEAQEFTYSLNMVFFSLGGTLFYYLLFKSGYVPKALAIFGLIVAPLALIGTLMELFGFAAPLYLFIPNLPFELIIGLWLLVKGISGTETT
jgi:hypothetical protein